MYSRLLHALLLYTLISPAVPTIELAWAMESWDVLMNIVLSLCSPLVIGVMPSKADSPTIGKE